MSSPGRLSHRSALFCTLSTLLSLASCAPSTDDARWAIVGGTEDEGDPAVAALIVRRTQCQPVHVQLLCTGTLIAPRVVLTAAHCLDPVPHEGAVEVLFGNGLEDGEHVVAMDTLVHPGYDEKTHENDLAQLLLSS